jgi:Zn-dependent peptidase ImmA (M78 family)
MDTQFWSKLDLYQSVDDLIDLMGISLTGGSFPLKSLDLAYRFCHNFSLEIIPFPSTKICGILCRDDNRTEIALNERRDKIMQNFDCMHELIHYFFHDGPVFNCAEKSNRSIEWQANEGAAQALVPYQLFIPEYVSRMKSCSRNQCNTIIIHSDLAELFNVTTVVIRNRINSLEYEIYQYLRGIPLSDIVILSKKQLERRGINKLIEHRTYCTHCRSIVNKNDNYCIACGNDLNDLSDWPNERTYSGVDYMIYQGLDVDESGKACICPRCSNEEMISGTRYCHICGIGLVNECGNESCGFPVSGNSRYCPDCGYRTTFFQQGFLKAWDAQITATPPPAVRKIPLPPTHPTLKSV